MFQTKVLEKIKTHFLIENRAVYEIMWKHIVERAGASMKMWRMRIVCWIPKAKSTHSECEILIVFPLQQWLQERASMLIRTMPFLFRSTFLCIVRRMWAICYGVGKTFIFNEEKSKLNQSYCVTSNGDSLGVLVRLNL